MNNTKYRIKEKDGWFKAQYKLFFFWIDMDSCTWTQNSETDAKRRLKEFLSIKTSIYPVDSSELQVNYVKRTTVEDENRILRDELSKIKIILHETQETLEAYKKIYE